jgi:hypothetical protein
LASKASEMYLRKISPGTTCLYSAASMSLRSASAAAHSVASKRSLAPFPFPFPLASWLAACCAWAAPCQRPAPDSPRVSAFLARTGETATPRGPGGLRWAEARPGATPLTADIRYGFGWTVRWSDQRMRWTRSGGVRRSAGTLKTRRSRSDRSSGVYSSQVDKERQES